MVVSGPTEVELRGKSLKYREDSVADSTKKARKMQWKSYEEACKKYHWDPYNCSVDQACLYVTYLAERLAYASIVAYYNAVVYMLVCKGLNPTRMGNPILKSTLEGIARVKGKGQNGKDPLLPPQLKKVAKVVDWGCHIEFLTFVAVLILFRTLLRVSHVVWSAHTLTRNDVKFNKKGMLLSIRSSKTRCKGSKVEYLPVLYSQDREICAVYWLKKFLKLFPCSRNDQLLSLDGKKFTYNMFRVNLKKLLSRANVVGDFASHSLRRGGATFMSMNSCTIAEIKARGGWKSNCVFKYIRQPLSHVLSVERKLIKKL